MVPVRTLISCALLAFPPMLQAGEASREKSTKLKPKLEAIFSRFLQRTLTTETLRWKLYPIKLAGTGIKLWEKPGLLMAEAPYATTRISLKTLTSGRLRVHEMRFKDGRIYLRYYPDGKINLASMVKDLGSFARKNYKPGQKQKVAYNIFRVDNARLDVIDGETGFKPFVQPFVVNAKGDISGLGPQTQFPFRLNAVLASTTAATTAEITGTIRNHPQIHGVMRRVPVGVLREYLPVVRWFEGEAHAEFYFSKAAAYTFWRVYFSADSIKTVSDLAFPLIQVQGFFHPYARSKLNLALIGKEARVEAVVTIKDLITKKVGLTVKSRDADVGECIEWFRTGFIMSQKPSMEGAVKVELAKPLVWQVTGRADIDAEFASVLGQRLIREVDGKVTLKLREGKLTDMPGFVKALALLKLSYIVKEDRGLPFKNVAAVIDIKDGVAQTREPILIESPLLNVRVAGRVNFPKQVINARIQLGNVWFTVKGPLDNPAVLRE